jgi:hypothetical protein
MRASIPAGVSTAVLTAVGTVVDANIGEFAFATADGSKTHSISVRFPVGKTIIAYWGDGSNDSYDGNDNVSVIMSHTYAGVGSYSIRLSGDYTSITLMLLTSQALSGDISGWSVFTNNIYLRNYINLFTGDMSGLNAMPIASVFELYQNDLSFESSDAWIGHNHNIRIDDNNMTSSDIDNAIIAFEGGSFSGRTIQMDGNNAAHTAASASALVSLRVANTVLVNEPVADFASADFASADFDV